MNSVKCKMARALHFLRSGLSSRLSKKVLMCIEALSAVLLVFTFTIGPIVIDIVAYILSLIKISY